MDGQLFAVLVSARSDVRQNVVQRPIQLPLGGGPLLGVHGEHQADGIVAVRVPSRQAVGVADKEKLGIVPGKGHIQGLRLAAAEQLAGERYLHPVVLLGRGARLAVRHRHHFVCVDSLRHRLVNGGVACLHPGIQPLIAPFAGIFAGICAVLVGFLAACRGVGPEKLAARAAKQQKTGGQNRQQLSQRWSTSKSMFLPFTIPREGAGFHGEYAGLLPAGPSLSGEFFRMCRRSRAGWPWRCPPARSAGRPRCPHIAPLRRRSNRWRPCSVPPDTAAPPSP